MTNKLRKTALCACLALGSAILINFQPGESTAQETIVVHCECSTAAIPSACQIKNAPRELVSYSEVAATNENIDWDEEFTSSYCYRKRPDQCLCDSIENISGYLD